MLHKNNLDEALSLFTSHTPCFSFNPTTQPSAFTKDAFIHFNGDTPLSKRAKKALRQAEATKRGGIDSRAKRSNKEANKDFFEKTVLQKKTDFETWIKPREGKSDGLGFVPPSPFTEEFPKLKK